MRRASLAFALVVLSASSAPAAAAPGVSVTPGPYRASARFVATYTGSGTYRTDYHSNPPNPGGNPDTNDAHDSSVQAWALTLDGSVKVPRCWGRPSASRAKSCLRGTMLTSAHGTTSASGQIDHSHIDGLFPADNASASCQLNASTAAGAPVRAGLAVTYLAHGGRVAITAHDPVANVLALLPQQCPSAPDGIDGLNDNYFMPGFSFAPGYGPDRWFSSAKVTLSARILHRARAITIHLGVTRSGKPPADCAVPYPAYQRCTTGGAWSGTLTLSRRGG